MQESSVKTETRVAVIGLGEMGVRMAQRVLDAGYTLWVYNRTAARADGLVAQGAHRASTPRAAAQEADVVITMLTADEASRVVWCDPERGVLGGLRDGALAITSSTLSAPWTVALAGLVRERGARFLDAPVVGTLPHAEQGALTHLVGGDAGALEAARDVLKTMSARIVHVGEQGGDGMRLKLAVNALFAAQVAALAEAVETLDRAGLSRGDALAMLRDMPTTSLALQGIGALMAAGDDAPRFPVRLVAKDMRLATALATEHGVDTPALDAVRQQFEAAEAAGLGDRNINALASLVADTSRS